jgi:hypothetical protein
VSKEPKLELILVLTLPETKRLVFGLATEVNISQNRDFKNVKIIILADD